MRRIAPVLLASVLFWACGDPDPPPTVKPVVGGADGAACVANSDCQGSFCLPSFLGYPDGYCTTAGCADGASCTDGARCLEFLDGTSACYAACDDCRDGYRCVDAGGQEVCVPADSNLEDVVLDPSNPFDQTLSVLGADCEPNEASGENRWRFEFSISEQARSFQFVPFVRSGEVVFESLQTPSQTLTRGEYRHHNTRLEDVGAPGREPFGTFGEVTFDWPVLVPYAPQFADLVEPGGAYAVEVSTDGAKPCLYTVENVAAASTIDLDIYLVTQNGPSASAAAEDPNFVEVLTAAETNLEQAGLTFGEVRFHDAPASVSERFAIVRDLRDIDLLAATGAPEGTTLDDHLSVDVFIVDSIIFSGITALGISAGVPGPAGMHGNLGNGLVFSAPDLGSDNALVGQVLAHELGHYLGLRHTTEILHGAGSDSEAILEEEMGSTDPIEDTPVCSNVGSQGSRCPDYSNLMFPTLQNLPEGERPFITQGQADTLRLSPLVKP